MDPTKKSGVNWNALLKIIAPVVGEVAGHGDRGSFMSGFQRAQERAEQKRQEEADAAQRMKVTGADFMLRASQALQGLDDPIDFENMLGAYERAGTTAGYLQPGELRGVSTFNTSKQSAAQLTELSEQLAQLEKSGYDVDQLAEAGATVKLTNGKSIAISAAQELTRSRPQSATGDPIARPKKAETAGTADERAARLKAQIRAATVAGDKAKATALQAEYDDLVSAASDLSGARRAPTDPELTELNKRLRELQVAAAENKISGTGAPKRQILSSDANRIAELDNSMSDVDVLERDLGQTGAASKIGAMLPNIVTEFTGWGTDAKQRQAVIDRVKQVIGKALEGGVLRKEDEYKYVKILPTIGDPPDVAKTKIQGLRAALQAKRQTVLDALEDANYDVTKFASRGRMTPMASHGSDAGDGGWTDLGNGVRVREKKP